MKPTCTSTGDSFFFLYICLALLSFVASLPSQITTITNSNGNGKPSASSGKPKAAALRKISSQSSYSSGSGPQRYDDTINEYLTERTCWWNEMCKEEFSLRFRCRCPLWSFCSSPGRYYNAYCGMSGTGYTWSQPKSEPSFFGQPKRPYKMMRVQKSRK